MNLDTLSSQTEKNVLRTIVLNLVEKKRKENEDLKNELDLYKEKFRLLSKCTSAKVVNCDVCKSLCLESDEYGVVPLDEANLFHCFDCERGCCTDCLVTKRTLGNDLCPDCANKMWEANK